FFKQGTWAPPYDPPLSLDDPSVAETDVENATGEFVEEYGTSSLEDFRSFLEGTSGIVFTRVHIPFTSPHDIHGLYLCLQSCSYTPKTLRFVFWSSNGSSVSAQCILAEMTHTCEWHHVSVDVSDVVRCDIEHESTWDGEDCSYLLSMRFIVQASTKLLKREKSGDIDDSVDGSSDDRVDELVERLSALEAKDRRLSEENKRLRKRLLEQESTFQALLMDQRKKLDSTREEISDLTQQLETVDGRSLFLEKQMGAQYSFFKQQLDSIKDQLTVQECCPSSPVKVKDGSM
ncbi:hypothetical protein ADUPG1_000680, partial [Aduncisulcus paluster]